MLMVEVLRKYSNQKMLVRHDLIISRSMLETILSLCYEVNAV